MKLLLLSLCAVLMAACTSAPASVKVDGIEATGSTKLGGKQMIYVKKGDTVVAIGDNNEGSFRDGVSGLKFGLGAWALTDIFSTGSAAYQSVTNSKTAADVTKTGAREATKQLGISEATKLKSLELEAAAMGVQ